MKDTHKGGKRLAAGSGGFDLKQLFKDRVWLACLLGIIAAVLLLILVVFLIYRSWARAPELPSADNSPAPTETLPDDTPEDDDPTELNGIQPVVSGDRKPGIYTFLIVGRDVDSGNTDTIMLASYDIAKQDAALMSIPRDTMVNATWDVKKINSVHPVNEASQEGSGMTALKRYVSGLVGFEPDFTVYVEWEAIGEIVDAIGGVYFDVPFDMNYHDPYQDLSIDQPMGYRLLDGEDAMEVIRWRINNDEFGHKYAPPGSTGSDLERTTLQQNFITAVLKQCLQIKNVTKITALAEIFTNRVETELSVGNLCYFAEQALLGGFSADDLFTCTMPNTAQDAYSRSQRGYLSYVFPKGSELVALVNEHFNPYEEDVTLANLDLMSLNADGSVSSSTGTVRDKQAAYPVSHWTTPDEPEPTEPEPGDDPSQPDEPGPEEPPADTPDPTESGPVPDPAPSEDPGEPNPVQSPEEPEPSAPAEPSEPPAEPTSYLPPMEPPDPPAEPPAEGE